MVSDAENTETPKSHPNKRINTLTLGSPESSASSSDKGKSKLELSDSEKKLQTATVLMFFDELCSCSIGVQGVAWALGGMIFAWCIGTADISDPIRLASNAGAFALFPPLRSALLQLVDILNLLRKMRVIQFETVATS